MNETSLTSRPVVYSPRARLFEESVIIEGITRSGKFLLASVVAALEGVESIQVAFTLEYLLMLHSLGKMDLETCRSLLHVDLDQTAFNMIIGRNLNTRPFDLSCVYRTPDYAGFLARATTPDRDELLRRFHTERRLPLHILHEGLCCARTLFDLMPKARQISILRDPASLALSWHKRGRGRLAGASDPKIMTIFFEAEGGPRHWWALDFPGDYASLTEMDRCVLSVARLAELGRRELEAGGAALRDRICFVTYEALLTRPDDVVARMGSFLGRKPTDALAPVLARERLPRPVSSDERARSIERIKQELTPRFVPVLERACADFDDYWAVLAR